MDVRRPFRKHHTRPADAPVGLGEVDTARPHRVRTNLPAKAGATVWTAGEFTDVGLTGADDLSVSIERRFSSPPAMFQAAVRTVDDREQLHRRGEEPDPAPADNPIHAG